MSSDLARKCPLRSGFTLIEVLLSIAIITVLTAVLYAAFGPVRERARQVGCMSNMRQIGQALAMYRADMDGDEASIGKYSSAEDLGLPPTKNLTSFFGKYKLEKTMLFCPSYKGQHGKEEGAASTYFWPMGNDEGIPMPFQFKTKTFKHGDASVIVFDENHNRLFNPSKEPNWTQKRVLVLRLNGQVDSLSVPFMSTDVDW